MGTRRRCDNAWCASVLLGVALLFFTVGGASGQTLSSAQVQAKVSAALAGTSDALEAAILHIFDGVPANQAGQVATDILAAAQGATAAQRTAIGKALAAHASALVSGGHRGAARAVADAIKSDPAALAAYESRASATSFTIPTGPVGAGADDTSPAQ